MTPQATRGAKPGSALNARRVSTKSIGYWLRNDEAGRWCWQAFRLAPGKSFAPSGQADTPPVLLEMTPIEITAEDDPGFTHLPDRIRNLHRWAAARKPVMPTIANAQGCLDAVHAATGGKPQPPRDLPLVVVSTGNETPNYAVLQKELLALSTNRRQMMAIRSFHAIQMSEPDVATAAIRTVVNAVLRGGRVE